MSKPKPSAIRPLPTVRSNPTVRSDPPPQSSSSIANADNSNENQEVGEEGAVHVTSPGLAGQLALMTVSGDSQVKALPLDLYNKRGRIILGVDSQNYRKQCWGAKYGRWSFTLVPPTPELPLGLHVLENVNRLFVSEQYIPRDELKSSKKPRRYLIRNQAGELVFVAKERINLKIAFAYGKSTQIDVRFYDPFKREIIFCRKLLKFSSSLCPCCTQTMKVMAQPSKFIAKVYQNFSPFGANFTVTDAKREPAFHIRATKRSIYLKKVDFDIVAQNERNVGAIKPTVDPEAGGKAIPKEIPILELSFKNNVQIVDKSRLLAAMFLIKYNYFD